MITSLHHPLFRSKSSCVPCFFGPSPQEDDGAYSVNVFGDASPPSGFGSVLLRPLVVFALWQLLAHAPFQLVGGAIAVELQHLLPAESVEGAVPAYGIDPILRASTTLADVLRIGFWWRLGRWYQRHEMETDAATGSSPPPPPDEAAAATSTGDCNSMEDGDRAPTPRLPSSPWPSRAWWELAVRSTLAWPLRMGHTLEAAGFASSFWSPLRLYAASRAGALAIGAVPGCVGGVPSLVTSFCLGLAYATYRDGLEGNLESRMDRARAAGSGERSVGEQVSAEGGGVSQTRGSDWGYQLRTILGYGYFTCFMVLWDAEVLGMVLTAEKEAQVESHSAGSPAKDEIF